MATYYTILAIYLCFAFASSLTATLTLPKFKNSPIKLATPILWAGFITEVSAFLYYEYFQAPNYWIFNVYHLVFYILFYLLMYTLLESKKRKKWVLVSGTLLLVIYTVIALYHSFNAPAIIYAFHVLTLGLLIFALIYAIELLKSNKRLTLKESPQFFFIVAYVTFYIIYMPLSIAYDLKLHVYSNEFYIFLKSIQGYILMVMHSIFIFGFLWTKRVVV